MLLKKYKSCWQCAAQINYTFYSSCALHYPTFKHMPSVKCPRPMTALEMCHCPTFDDIKLEEALEKFRQEKFKF
jgi:hypothetical protein